MFNFAYNYPQVARDSGFKLRNYKDGPLDWRLVGSMEIERILKDQSFEQIDAVLSHLSEVPLGSILDSNILDSGISKYFMLSQFSVQYLIFCRKFLEETVTDLRETHSISQMEIATLKRNLSEANNEILQLHKKITQMEAIHEIIYPCYLCTKNFVSNDALNLHISRKHNGSLAKSEKKSDVSQPLCKEHENDLTLINTIKLELEIKQLKERLNNAEREIKEKNFESEIKHVPEIVSAPEKSERNSVHSIGIQSNLSEIKESDESSLDELSTSSLKRQLFMLQEKLHEFEKWKEEQRHENSEFLTGINKKLQDIGTSLEITRNQRIEDMDNAKQKSSVEDLETLLTKKVEEISKVAATNLEYVVKNIELNYKDKLHQLEKELIKLNEQYILQKDFKSDENHRKMEECCLRAPNTQSADKMFNVVEVIGEREYKNNADDSMRPQKAELSLKETSVSESNHTFVKSSNVAHFEENSDSYDNSTSTSGISEENCTDVSGSLLDEENVEKIDNELIKVNTNQTHSLKEKSSRVQEQQPQPKIMTKSYARKLANNRLSSLGVNIKSKTLTPLLKKKFLDDLNKGRNKLKQKHPQFYAARNKIKKFVDKLCSNRMPPNAKALLKVTKPKVRTKVQKNSDDDEYSSSEKEGDASLKASTPLNENPSTDSENFKQRLERILASPIRKPDDHRITAIVHREDTNKNPVPMPRKRVMFGHPEVQERRSNHSLSLTDSDESQSFERHQDQNVKI